MVRSAKATIQLTCLASIFFFIGWPAHAQIPSSCVVGTNIYYISQTGSDSNTQAQAKSKSTPWKHSPYMRSFTGSYSHTAGDCFVFRGGDTWTNSDFQLALTNGGNSSKQDYYGVDQTWYTGASWTRPIFDLGAAQIFDKSGAVTSDVVEYSAGYITVDNIEWIRAYWNSTTSLTFFSTNGAGNTNLVFTNNYIHNFQYALGATKVATVIGGNSVTGDVASYNVIDGSDGNKGYMLTFSAQVNSGGIFTYNVVHDVCSAINNAASVVAYNLIYNIGPVTQSNVNCAAVAGYHPDGIRLNGGGDIHDNVLTNCTGETVSIQGTGNIYNNVIYATQTIPIQAMDTGAQLGDTVSIYNNTIESATKGTVGFRLIAATGTVNIYNNHWINSAGNAAGAICIGNDPISSGCASATTLNYSASAEVYQTLSTANGQGYSSVQTYVYSPASSSNSTVTTAGNNLTSNCSSTMLLCVDTRYGVTQASRNIAIGARTQDSRSSSGNWQVGAYQFSSGSGTGSVQPPSGLTASVN